jgi:uncharacterized delta-60 repeat protein
VQSNVPASWRWLTVVILRFASLCVAIGTCLLGALSARGAPGDLDAAFGVDPVAGPGPFGPGVMVSDRHEGSAYARGLALTGDGKIVFALGGTYYVERRLPDGLPDVSFGTNGIVVAGIFNLADVALRDDGQVVAAGSTFNFFGRYEYKGALVQTGPSAGYNTLEIEDLGSRSHEFTRIVMVDGHFIVGGVLHARTNRFTVSRYLANGGRDLTFGARGRTRVRGLTTPDGPKAIVPLPDGSIVGVGTASAEDGADFAIFRVDPTGRLDRAFGVSGSVTTTLRGWDQAFDAAVQEDGKIVVAGTTGDSPTSGHRFVVLRYLPDGNLDPGFGPGGGIVETDFGADAEAYAVDIQPDGKIVAAGEAGETLALARYLPDGTLDLTFGDNGLVMTPLPPGNSVEAREMVLQPDGKILVAGLACREPAPAAPCYYPVLARYLSD